MEMQWDKVSREMRASMQRSTTFKSIANGVFTQLASLTPDISANRNKQIDKLYLDYTEVLFIADLAPQQIFLLFRIYGKQMEKKKIN
eukprot:14004146-Ditylum_brightwellii.AAC.1